MDSMYKIIQDRAGEIATQAESLLETAGIDEEVRTRLAHIRVAATMIAEEHKLDSEILNQCNDLGVAAARIVYRSDAGAPILIEVGQIQEKAAEMLGTLSFVLAHRERTRASSP